MTTSEVIIEITVAILCPEESLYWKCNYSNCQFYFSPHYFRVRSPTVECKVAMARAIHVQSPKQHGDKIAGQDPNSSLKSQKKSSEFIIRRVPAFVPD